MQSIKLGNQISATTSSVLMQLQLFLVAARDICKLLEEEQKGKLAGMSLLLSPYINESKYFLLIKHLQ